AHGGPGCIVYNAELKTLFIHQTEEVQEAVRDFLDARRHEIELHKKDCERQVGEKGARAGKHFGIWDPGDNDDAPPADLILTGLLKPVQLQVAPPPIDPGVVKAYDEILQFTPERIFLETYHPAVKEPCKPVEDAIPTLTLEEEPCELSVILCDPEK